ncbi:HAMP domain-containing protein [Pseudobacteriovorax antillogorgiicola]|uniref:HAMP domain-containing protein n=1 Tax=Pseudobacteriovorax antillogorgiicola TaxID=1513793 RepID=A0A1Y6BJI0_9BACT|nr:HAMP domain-containing protein [Pseudobacteriovorax antillogorgiicola]TCS55311.1 HAMP domain-containing protein [Pseudobacteriovorax antillogorgiicola]SMF14371.1 HAMP domain-containing protein [Pseudobacteriovorax antillogorgiicola]
MKKNVITRPNRNLKAVLIEPFKQMKLGIYVIAVSLTFTALTALVFLNAFFEQYQHVMEMFQIVDPKNQYEMVTNDVFYKNAVRIGILLVSFIVVTLSVVFHVTHKYYGPLVSINRFVDGVTKGDYSQRVVIRRGDELQDLAHSLNKMAETLQKRHGIPIDDVPAKEGKGAG